MRWGLGVNGVGVGRYIPVLGGGEGGMGSSTTG